MGEMRRGGEGQEESKQRAKGGRWRSIVVSNSNSCKGWGEVGVCGSASNTGSGYGGMKYFMGEG